MEEDITLSSLFHWQPRSHKTCSLWKISLTIFKEMHSSTRCIYYSPRPPTTHLPSTPLQPLEPSTISSTTPIKAQATHPPLWVPFQWQGSAAASPGQPTHPFEFQWQGSAAASKIDEYYYAMNQHQNMESGKIIASVIVLLASSFIVLYQSFGNRVGGISDGSASSDGGRSRGLTSASFGGWGVRLRARTSGCGLWHPSVDEWKTWYVRLKRCFLLFGKRVSSPDHLTKMCRFIPHLTVQTVWTIHWDGMPSRQSRRIVCFTKGHMIAAWTTSTKQLTAR